MLTEQEKENVKSEIINTLMKKINAFVRTGITPMEAARNLHEYYFGEGVMGSITTSIRAVNGDLIGLTKRQLMLGFVDNLVQSEEEWPVFIMELKNTLDILVLTNEKASAQSTNNEDDNKSISSLRP